MLINLSKTVFCNQAKHGFVFEYYIKRHLIFDVYIIFRLFL